MGEKYKILIIDNIDQDAETIKSGLPEQQFHTQSAVNNIQVKEYLKSQKPDLVFLGIEIEDLNPLAVSKNLSRIGIAVILLCKEPTRQVLIESYKNGVSDLIVRPLSSENILEKVEKALRRSGKILSEKEEIEVDFSAAKSPHDKIEVVLKNIDELLALPFAVIKMIRLCNSSKSTASDFEKPVESDPAISAIIMRRATSAAFASQEKIRSIQRAIVRIGLKETRNIATSLSVFKLFSKEEKAFGFNRIWFWTHSLTTGICAKILSEILRSEDPENAFLSGLLHDIGKMVLDDFLNSDFQQAVQKAHTEGIAIRIAEESVFETDHAYLGGTLAMKWGFPHSIAEAISDHHRYKRLAVETGELSTSAIVCMADQMAKALQVGSGGDFIVDPEALSLWDNLPKELPWYRVIKKIVDELNEYMKILEVPPDHFQMETPEQNRGTVGIYAPATPNYSHLLKIAVEKSGFQSKLFSSTDMEDIKKDDLVLLIGDFTSVGDEDVELYQKNLSSIMDKKIIISQKNKEEPFKLDFFWFDSQLNDLLGQQESN